ncbi:MAG: class I fructose-bisphosphate aldolase [Patescibacteria group bacterium]
MSLHTTVQTLMRDGKGILALDDSVAILEKRFSTFNIPYTEESRRLYREVVLGAVGIEKFLSGVILSEEAMRQSGQGGLIFPELLASKNILVGVHLDGNISENLEQRMQEYKSLGVVCAKRSIEVAVTSAPAGEDFHARTRELADFARVSQKKEIIPIIGLQLVHTDSSTASEMEDALIAHLSLIVDFLKKEGIDPKGVILETSMTSGAGDTLSITSHEVAERTVRALTTSIPENIAGVLLSGSGETPEVATADLNAIARLEPFPWPVAFCFSRALQEPVLAVWEGKKENVAEAQAALFERLSLNVRADVGGYGSGMESR